MIFMVQYVVRFELLQATVDSVVSSALGPTSSTDPTSGTWLTSGTGPTSSSVQTSSTGIHCLLPIYFDQYVLYLHCMCDL